jgi:CBS domain-containing protein
MDQIAELMTASPLATISGDALVAQASRLMGEQSVSHLLVFDDERLVGVVCVCDLDRADTGTLVRACVTRAPLTLDAGVSVGEAAHVMREEGINCLPLTRQVGHRRDRDDQRFATRRCAR